MPMIDGSLHEREVINSFIQPKKRDRCLAILLNPRRRCDFTRELAHFRWFDERFAHPLHGGLIPTPKHAISHLLSKGSPFTVWLISEDRKLDGMELPLEDAICAVWGGNMGTIISCVPGKLGFFRGEDMQSELLLERS